MFTPPLLTKTVLTLAHPAVPPIPLEPAAMPPAPRTAVARAARAMLEALDVALSRREQLKQQTPGGAEPIIFIAAPDSAAGRKIIARSLLLAGVPGDASGEIIFNLAGPYVFAVSFPELGSLLGPSYQAVVAQLAQLDGDVGRVPNEARVILAVNTGLEVFALRVEEREVPAEPPAPDKGKGLTLETFQFDRPDNGLAEAVAKLAREPALDPAS